MAESVKHGAATPVLSKHERSTLVTCDGASTAPSKEPSNRGLSEDKSRLPKVLKYAGRTAE